jgi:hypothetical protein
MTMRLHPIRFFVWLPLAVTLGAISAPAQNNRHQIRANLAGYEEVASISSTGSGEFRVRLSDAALEFELSYAGLEGNVLQAHIHLGQIGVNGGIMVFLCSNLGNGPAGTPPCPQSGTVTGVRMAADVVGPSGQGIAAGEAGVFGEVLRALRSGSTYANVHTDKHTGGEIRGQLRTDNGRGPR